MSVSMIGISCSGELFIIRPCYIHYGECVLVKGNTDFSTSVPGVWSTVGHTLSIVGVAILPETVLEFWVVSVAYIDHMNTTWFTEKIIYQRVKKNKTSPKIYSGVKVLLFAKDSKIMMTLGCNHCLELEKFDQNSCIFNTTVAICTLIISLTRIDLN